jgi:hypothetical protein
MKESPDSFHGLVFFGYLAQTLAMKESPDSFHNDFTLLKSRGTLAMKESPDSFHGFGLPYTEMKSLRCDWGRFLGGGVGGKAELLLRTNKNSIRDIYICEIYRGLYKMGL